LRPASSALPLICTQVVQVGRVDSGQRKRLQRLRAEAFERSGSGGLLLFSNTPEFVDVEMR
jgi:hypothetical protein